MATVPRRVGLLWPGDPTPGHVPPLASTRLATIARTLETAGFECVPVIYRDDIAYRVRADLSALDAVLVWVNPVERHGDRRVLDALLGEVAAGGVLVSAHPDTIRRIGTKEVLFHTRGMTWGSDTRLYETHDALRTGLSQALASGGIRVLKQWRGNGGDGVWQVACADRLERGARIGPDTVITVRHARRGSVEERVPFTTFVERCRPYFEGEGRIIDQVYQPRLVDGMVRCYLVGDRVEGFGEQKINALYPAAPGADPDTAPQPGARLYFPPTRPDFQHLKRLVESEWVGELCRVTGLASERLPLVWDLDFLYGPRDPAGLDTYVLCEINVSCVFPFPDSALGPIATLLHARLDAR